VKKLFAVDLDDTMLGDERALRLLNHVLENRRERLALAYVTGRCRSSALELLKASTLLAPDYLVTDVGSEICWGLGWQPDQRWQRKMSADWHLPRLRAVAELFPVLTPQPPSHQGNFKLSYYLHHLPTLPLLTDTLRRQRLRARLIYSSGRDLDIVPAGSGKGAAVAWLAARLGLLPAQVFTCGDSGNDAEMLGGGYCSVAVGNAKPELLNLIPGTVYRARAGYAAGVLEGLRHYGWL